MENESEATETVGTATLRPIALIVGAGKEPDPYLTETDAQGSWVAASCLWHPALLAKFKELPRLIDVFDAGVPEPGQLVLVAHGSAERLASGFRTQAGDSSGIIIDGGSSRPETIDLVLERLGFERGPDSEVDRSVANDFLVLGTAHWWLADLTLAMNHADCLDHASFEQEALAAAQSWISGDHASATNRLRAAFELLTQAREKFYPVDAYLIDLCLLDPTTRPSALDDTLRSRTATTLLAPAEAIANLARRDPDRMQSLRDAIRDGWADVIGGTWSENEESLLPLSSVIWQYRKGALTYREHLDDRNVETWARRRFGLHSQVPQIAKRFGLRFGLPMSFDASKFPLRSEVKRLWESPDGSTLECLYRPPVSGDLAAEGVRLPWRIGLTMKDDHSATLTIVHWASSVADWYKDLRRISAYSPALSRWVTMNDYFHLTDRPFEGVRPQPDDYQSPYFEQDVARPEVDPISKVVKHTRTRLNLDAAEALRSVALCLTESHSELEDQLASPDDRETLVETGQTEECERQSAIAVLVWGQFLAKGILGNRGEESRPGFLVFNPLGQPRRAIVLLPGAAPDLQPEGPLRGVQLTDEGVLAVVELPAFGYAWVPRESNHGLGSSQPVEVSLKDSRLKNALLELQVDSTTGGMRGLHGPAEETARVGQQLSIRGLVDEYGSPVASKMVVERVEPDYAGPILSQATSYGHILDGNGIRLAQFEQRFRVWSGRPTAELDISLSNVAESWLAQLQHGDPWQHAFVCRWAWPDKDAMLRKLEWGHPWETVVERIETPEGFDISTRRQRTALLFGGLPYHRRHSSRMLDSYLIAGQEQERRFQFGLALDLEHPFQAAQEWLSPAFVVATDAGPPKNSATGWLFTLDQKTVMVTSLRFHESTEDGRSWGVRLVLSEVGGRSSRCKLRCFRSPVSARQLDFSDELLVDLTVEDDTVMVELTPHEIAYVEITLG